MSTDITAIAGAAPIYEQINEYAWWKKQHHPWIAGARKALLYRFANSFKVQHVQDISVDHIAFFTGEELTEFYSEQALKTLRDFLWYSRRAGYRCISYKMATKEELKKPMGRPIQWDMVQKIKEMKESGLSDETIARLLTKSLGKKVHKTSVERWRHRIPDMVG